MSLYLVLLCFISLGKLSTGTSNVTDGPTTSTLSSEEDQEKFREIAMRTFAHEPWYNTQTFCSKKIENYTKVGCQKLPDYAKDCFGAKLNYDYATRLVYENSTKIGLVEDELKRYELYYALPDCWQYLRIVLCAVYKAPCNQTENTKLLVQDYLCTKALKKCGFLREKGLWPEFLGECKNWDIFSTKCKSRKQGHLRFTPKFPTSAQCLAPLVKSKFEAGWKLPGCALNCTNPWFISEDHATIKYYIGLLSWSSFVFSIFTWMIMWCEKGQQQLPLRPLHWAVLCYIVICFCWLLTTVTQFTCRSDGSVRLREPSPDDSSLCVCQFYFLYGALFLLMVSMSLHLFIQFTPSKWCTEMAQLWRNFDNEFLHVFHLFWTFFFLPPIPVIYLKRINTDGYSGVCFVGGPNELDLIWWFYLPIASLPFFIWLFGTSIWCFKVHTIKKLELEIIKIELETEQPITDQINNEEQIGKQRKKSSSPAPPDGEIVPLNPLAALQTESPVDFSKWKSGILLVIFLFCFISSLLIHIFTEILQNGIREPNLMNYIGQVKFT